MSAPHSIKDWWKGVGHRAQQVCRWFNRVARFCNLMEGRDGLEVEHTSESVRIGPAADYAMVPAPPDSGFYVLTAYDGVMAWRPARLCTGEEATP